MPITTPTPPYTQYMHTQRRSNLFDVKEREVPIKCGGIPTSSESLHLQKETHTHIVTILLHYRKQSHIND